MRIREDHPNFAYETFKAKVIADFYASLLGDADFYRVDKEKLNELVEKFCVKAERLANYSARSPVTFDNPDEGKWTNEGE